MAHAQKPDSVFQRNGRVHLYRRGCQFSRVLAFLEFGSAENDCSNTAWTVPSQTEDCLATHSIRLFPLHFSSRASPCATSFRFHSMFISSIAVLTGNGKFCGCGAVSFRPIINTEEAIQHIFIKISSLPFARK